MSESCISGYAPFKRILQKTYLDSDLVRPCKPELQRTAGCGIAQQKFLELVFVSLKFLHLCKEIRECNVGSCFKYVLNPISTQFLMFGEVR